MAIRHITITDKHDNFLRRHFINLSRFVDEKIEEYQKEMIGGKKENGNRKE